MLNKFLDSLLISIPLVTLYASLDFIVHAQYDYVDDFYPRILNRHAPLLPVMIIMIMITSSFQSSKFAQFAFAIVSCLCGCLLIHYSQDNGTFGSMLLTPGLAILWIYFIIQMNLTLAVVTLLGNILFYYRNDILLMLNPTFKLQ